jgi:lipid A ethanolaminephosphotransferase
MKKITISSSKLILILTIYFSTVLNLSFWRYIYNNLDVTNFRTACFALSTCFFIAIPLFLLFNLTIVKKLAKPFTIILLLLSSSTNFMMFKYGVYIDRDMMQNVVETNFREATDLITVSLLLWVFITGIIPSILLIITKIQYKPLKIELKTRLKYSIFCLLIASVFAGLLYKEYVSFGRNNGPVRSLINVFNYTVGTINHVKRMRLAKKQFVQIDTSPQFVDFTENGQFYTVVIFIIGETARASSFSLGGYERKTNPLLEKQDIAYFKSTSSCGTSTAISIPCMFSHRNRNDFDSSEARYTENLVDLAQKSGYKVIWKENDDGCKNVCNRINNLEVMKDINNPKYCRGNYCLDESLLDDLEKILASTKQNTFIILHTQGSHGPTYYQRYPDEFKQFTPTCDTEDIQNCSTEQIVNTYDNTILYTDFIISSTIDIVKKFPQFKAGVLYVSDHGESLGENNIYLHGMPYKFAPAEQKNVPMLIWLNENMKKSDYINYDCLKEQANKNIYSHDNIFHSLLRMLKIKTSVYNGDYDLFKTCSTKK